MQAETELMTGDAERQIDREAEAGAENILHDIASVSADGNHLPVGHVDDAHEAKRDRETQRYDEKDGAEAESAKNGSEEIDPLDVTFDCADRKFCLVKQGSA